MIRTKPHWKNLKGVDAWLPELKQLLAEAEAAATQPKSEPRLKVAGLLAGFIQESWPQNAEMDRLDALAQETVNSLMLADIAARLGGIAGRTAEYAKLAKDLEAATERNQAAADAIRLQGIQQLIDATTQTIVSAKALVASLDPAKAGDKKIAALIEETVAAVEKLRSETAALI
jgi:hypothetical protein